MPPGWGQATSPLALSRCVTTETVTFDDVGNREEDLVASTFVATPKENQVSLPSHILKEASVVKEKPRLTKSVTTSSAPPPKNN